MRTSRTHGRSSQRLSRCAPPPAPRHGNRGRVMATERFDDARPVDTSMAAGEPDLPEAPRDGSWAPPPPFFCLSLSRPPFSLGDPPGPRPGSLLFIPHVRGQPVPQKNEPASQWEHLCAPPLPPPTCALSLENWLHSALPSPLERAPQGLKGPVLRLFARAAA